MNKPSYDLEKIKFATDEQTFKRAVDLYVNGKVTEFNDNSYIYSATVLGTRLYHVFVSSSHYNQGDCECYLGQHDTLCKHMVAVAIYAVKEGKTLTKEDKLQRNQLIFSKRRGKLTETKLSELKRNITSVLRYIKPYRGPSRIWFSYQNSLEEGCNRLSALLSQLPASRQTAEIIVNLLLRLDKKLSYGVDDFNGTVGSFIEEVVRLLKEFTKADPKCKTIFGKLKGRETSFGWKEPLLKLL